MSSSYDITNAFIEASCTSNITNAEKRFLWLLLLDLFFSDRSEKHLI